MENIENNLKEGEPESLDAAMAELGGLAKVKMGSGDAEFRVNLAQLYHTANRYVMQMYLGISAHD